MRWTGVIACGVAAAIGGCKKETAREKEKAKEPAADVVVAVDAPDAAPDSKHKITISIAEPHSGPTLGVRCSLEGDPLTNECGRGTAIAIDGDGRVYATDKRGVRRFVVKTATADTCELALDPTFATRGVLLHPAVEPAPQKLGDGPVFMASGDAEWVPIAGTGATMYYVEFLRGVHRIDGGTAEPVCPALQGLRGLAVLGKDAVVSRVGGERVTLRGTCKRVPNKLEPAPSVVVALRGAVWATLSSGKVVKYGADGTAAFTLGAEDSFGPGGFCFPAAIAACGADVCVIDSNCQKVERFTEDGTFVREIKSDDLFASHPYGLRGGVGAADGALWLAAEHKDGDTCEGAIYRVAER